MPRHLISDAHEWINEIPTVPIYYLAKPQPRERAWHNQRGKKTLKYTSSERGQQQEGRWSRSLQPASRESNEGASAFRQDNLVRGSPGEMAIDLGRS